VPSDTGPDPDSHIDVFNDNSSFGGDSFFVVAARPDLSAPALNGSNLRFVKLLLSDSSSTLFNTAEILPGSLNFSSFDLHELQLFFEAGIVYIPITSFENCCHA